ncbi:hypothetical protein J6590_086768 [Homalodisca vitripennis]|nr:hypothetical protein J6590_086768 [Homalodisca vitripennis]
MVARGVSHRDAWKVRLLLDQVHENPGEFSAAGFVKLNTQLFIYFITLGVDFAIMLYQNLACLKRLVSPPGTPVLSQNSTLL